MIQRIAVFLVSCCTVVQAGNIPIEGGLVVCIGAQALDSVAQDWEKPGCVFHCLETSDAEVTRLRKKIQAAGCYGKVCAARFDCEHLPYINNLVNLIVIRDTRHEIRDEELKRVLAPRGRIIAPAGTRIPHPVSRIHHPDLCIGRFLLH